MGATKRSLSERDREHLRDLRKGVHHNPIFQSAWNKYGKDAFELIIRKTFNTLKELNEAERKVVKEEEDRLYNIAPGGNCGFQELEAKRKISEGLKKPLVAMNIKTREIREYSSGIDASKDGFDPRAIGGACNLSVYESDKYKTCKRISHHGWVWMYKKYFSLEEMNKRVELYEKYRGLNQRSVVGKNLGSGEIVEFKSASEAVKSGFNPTNINAVCCGRARSHSGYVWCHSDVDGFEKNIEKKFTDYLSNPPKTGPKNGHN